MTTVRELDAAMQSLAPLECAAEWDNVGLLAGAAGWPAGTILLTIDLTRAVLDEAIDAGAQAIVAYHPPIFAPLKALNDRSPRTRLILDAVRAGIALYSPHTALDAAPGGVNDWLAEGLGPGRATPLDAHAHLPAGEANKVVTMCPANAVSVVHQAMCDAGAGVIGDYTQCSFRLKGDGTFFGGTGTDPAVGARGRVEHVDEIRLEMVCGDARLAAVIAALRRAHPYEEPPIEVHPLKARPSDRVGQGRLVRLHAAASEDELIARLKAHLGVAGLDTGTAAGAPERHETIGLCAGAGGSLRDAAIDAGATLFVTGEMRHHDVLDALARGCSIMLAGHTNTERGFLPRLAERLGAALPSARIAIAQHDRAPLESR